MPENSKILVPVCALRAWRDRGDLVGGAGRSRSEQGRIWQGNLGQGNGKGRIGSGLNWSSVRLRNPLGARGFCRVVVQRKKELLGQR